MALSLLLRSQKLTCSPLISNVVRLSTSSTIASVNRGLIPTRNNGIFNEKPVVLPWMQIKPENASILGRFVHRATAADDTSKSHGNHDKLWTMERLVSAGLLGIIPVGLMFPSQGLDSLMAISIIMHQYWGLEAIVVDYIRPSIFGEVIPKIAHVLLLLITASTLGGLFYFIYNDIGIAKSIRKLWAIKGQ